LSEQIGNLALYDDELEEAARTAFAREFTLPDLVLPTGMHIQALHQELRLAIALWYDTKAAGLVWHTPLAQLVGRDQLVLAVGPDGEKRIVRIT
jgi:hypothetical protein